MGRRFKGQLQMGQEMLKVVEVEESTKEKMKEGTRKGGFYPC